MKQYRKKPVVIEAVEISQENFAEIARIDGVQVHCPSDKQCEPVWSQLGYVMIRTLEGTMRGDIGDWIIKGVKGEVYPCKADIFALTYDELDGSAS